MRLLSWGGAHSNLQTMLDLWWHFFQTFVSDWQCFAQWKSSKSPTIPLKQRNSNVVRRWSPLFCNVRAAINGHVSAESHSVLRLTANIKRHHNNPSFKWLFADNVEMALGCAGVHNTPLEVWPEQKHKDTATLETLINTKTESIALNVRQLWIYHNVIILTWLFFFLQATFWLKQSWDCKTYNDSKNINTILISSVKKIALRCF